MSILSVKNTSKTRVFLHKWHAKMVLFTNDHKKENELPIIDPLLSFYVKKSRFFGLILQEFDYFATVLCWLCIKCVYSRSDIYMWRSIFNGSVKEKPNNQQEGLQNCCHKFLLLFLQRKMTMTGTAMSLKVNMWKC